jgi:hypothetical protein
MGPQKELLLDSCPAMELPSPRFGLSELRVRARSSSLLGERLRFAHELNNFQESSNDR